MTTSSSHVVQVEYCRSCETHSWCTHHEEAKYHDTFLKLSQLIAERHPHLEVIGNMVPSHLIPFKIAQNKYIDAHTHKYVLYPQIGSFEVLLDGNVIFSKKEQNAWPNLNNIINKISIALDPNFVCPPQQSSCSPRQKESKSPRKEKLVATPVKKKPNDIHKSHDQKKTTHKEPIKGFTLTDHFKLYKSKHNHDDKDWQTEKQESETSSKQLSEFGRTQSREKSQGESTKVILRDLSGETKLKEMLRSRGVLVKDQGRKQMIIKLDSIEEENAYEDNNITQRTTDKHHKTTKIQELEDAFCSLQNKFINFQTKVQDIHTRKEQFELKGGHHDDYIKKKTDLRREESLKQQEKILPSFQRPYNDRPSKLEQYLSASEQQKNQKLHRIYGEWKLLKQTAKKNKRMLKNKKSPQRQEQGESDEETSLSNSHSSANIIAFRPKKSQNPMQEHIQSVLKKGHKKSTIESYQASFSGIPSSSSQPRFRTEQHFYQGHLKKQKLHDDRQEQSMPVARLFKNSTNTISVEEMRTALRQSNPKLMKQQQTEVSKFSHNAKQSINKIQAKMNQLQHQLSQHKENKMSSPSYQQLQQPNHAPAHVGSAQSKRSMSHSSASSSSSNYQQFNRYQPLKKGQSPHKHIRQGSHQKNEKIGSQQKYRPQRNSYTGKAQQIQKATSKKINHSRFTNNSESTRKNYGYQQGGPGSFAIEEQSEPKESYLNTQRSNHRHEPTASHVSSRTTQNPNRKHPPLAPKGKKNLLDPNNHTDELSHHRQQKEYLEQSRQYHGQNREIHRQSRENHGSSREYNQQSKKNHRQKSSRLNKHELHEPVTFLRKQKDWKQSELHNQSKSQRHSRIVEQETQKNVNPNRSNVSQSSRKHHNKSNISQSSRNKVKPSMSKFSQYSSRSKKIETFKQKSSKSSKIGQEPKKLDSQVAQAEKRAYGRIKKNNKKVSHHSKPEYYNQETTRNEGYQNYQKQMGSDQQIPGNQTGRLVNHQGNKRILRYYRSQDICYEGKSSRPVYVDGSSGEEAEKQGVQGWAMQSEDENSQCPFNESGQERYQEENECQENNLNSQLNRRNSLDKQLDHIGDSKNNQQTLVPLMSGDGSSENVKIDIKSQQSTKDKVLTEGKNSEDKNNDEKISKENNVKKTKKANKQKKAKINNKEKKQTKKQNQDLDKIVSKQYSQFLLAKIVYELTKQQKKTKQCPVLENNQYENEQITVQVNYCQSIESIEGPVEQVPIDFLSFKTTQLNQQELAEQIQQSEKKEDYEESAEESDQEDEYEEQNEKQQKEDKNENTIGFAGAVVPLLSENNKKTTSQKVEETSSVLKNKAEQSDNVYSQAKEPNKFKEVGIQKEASVQISVQTEDMVEERVMTAKNSSVFTPSSPSNHQSIPNKTHPNFYKKSSQKQVEKADIIPKIYSNDIDTEISKFATVIEGNLDFIHEEDGNVAKADQIYPQGCLMKERTLELDLIATRFTNLLKAVDILCEKSEWLVTRLFQDKQGILSNKSFGVWLCKDHRWECFVLDNNFQVNAENQLLYSQHQGNQMWFNVLEKGFALALGGYDQLQKADSSFLFSMLTGCNWISSKIKEDPTKSGKLLQLITDSLRKNYIIHATKNHIKEKNQSRESLFYINSIRKAGQETLIEMSQDGMESFWVKLTKFVQQFSKVDILQLRINYHFTHLDLGIPRPEKLTVVQLDFQEEGQGCVTLSSPGNCGSLRVFLYRQEKSKVLKLVGQAKEKNKSSLFFQCNFTEGKYYVFTQGQQSALRLSFAGQTQPVINITEQINSEGLKNDMAEYLPVNDKEDKLRRTQQEWGIRSSKARLRDNFFESRLRQTFVDYILGRGKRQ